MRDRTVRAILEGGKTPQAAARAAGDARPVISGIDPGRTARVALCSLRRCQKMNLGGC
jgi:hypothetical protein